MRLWSLHPRILDRAALVAGWREGLLAQAVLAGRTKGYRNHPQLDRFRDLPAPDIAIASWLMPLASEADSRGYQFDRTRISAAPDPELRIPVTDGQLQLELAHLRAKVRGRSPEWEPHLTTPAAHPLFSPVPGPVEPWERAAQP